MTVSAVCRIVNQTLGVVIPAVAAAFVVGAMDGTSPGPGVVIAILFGLALAKGVFRYLEQFTGHAVAFRLLARVRNQVFRWLERLEPAGLEGQRSGDLVSRVSGDISRVEPLYAHTIAPAIAAVVVPLIVVLGLALVVSPWPALVIGVLSALYLGSVPWLGYRRVARRGEEARRRGGEAAARVADIVQGSREIAVLSAGSASLSGIGRTDRELAGLDSGLARDVARRSFLGGAIAAAAILGVVLVSTLRDLGSMELAVSVVVAWAIMRPLRSLEEIVPDTEQSLAAAGRLFELENLEAQGHGDREVVAGDIDFNRVRVVAGAEPLVDSVDLNVPGGSFLGVVGPSGSGKSTLVSTLVRHRDPATGRVLVGDEELLDLSPGALRRTFAFVPQRPDVFSGTIASNLAIANPDATREDMLAALERARLAQWVRGLDDGLDTPVGERGIGMSGGQLQRLSVARAFLRDPAVLILDEATSELDMETEKAVLKEIYAEQGTRTLIVVAHRMETVKDADAIAVLDRGRLVELGTHDDLKNAGGLYTALWERHEDTLPV